MCPNVDCESRKTTPCNLPNALVNLRRKISLFNISIRSACATGMVRYSLINYVIHRADVFWKWLMVFNGWFFGVFKISKVPELQFFGGSFSLIRRVFCCK